MLRSYRFTILVVLLSTFLTRYTFADCSGTSPNWVASPDYASVSSCISRANPGDTINVSAGMATWSSILTITKGLTLQGAGIDNTVIICNVANSSKGLFYFLPDATARTANNLFRVTGFTIDLNNLSNGSNGIMLYNGYKATPSTKVRIDHNKFINAERYRSIYIMGAVYGVADNNTFLQCNHCVDGEGTGSNAEWENLPRNFGTYENFYIEDNTFTNNNITYSHVYHAGGHGGRYVARYNTYNQTGTQCNNPGMLDIHGNGMGGYGMTINELYGNKFNMRFINSSSYILDQRGSKTLFFYNQLNTNTATTGHYNRIREEQADSDPTAPSGNPGNYIMHVNESYYWNNRHSSNGSYLIKAILGTGEECCAANAGYGQSSACCYNLGGTVGIAENIDFFNQNTSYNGTTQRGIYCGTTLPESCMVGDGAWITTQSCTSVDDANVGANPTTPISGTLYKCTALNTWTQFYEPYTYPHPLRSIMQHPQNLKIVP